MKNIIIIICIVMIFVIIGCDIGNTPTSRTEAYLTKYQMLDVDIDTSYFFDDIITNNEEREDCKELVKKQYRNLIYEIKDEKIDGKSANVEVEIEVLDYKSTIDNNFDNIIDKLKNVKDKVAYTIVFNVVKDKNGNWYLNDISDDDKLKLVGMK